MLHNAWYCAALSEELTRGAVIGRKLLGQNMALYRSQTGEVRALGAVCPHRGADLSRGRVIGDVLQCPLHGWCFEGSGKCVRIPSQPESVKIPARARASTWVVKEQQGFIWVWPEAEADVEKPPWYEEWEIRPDRARYCERPRLWKCSFVNAVENAIDTTHIPFVHVKTLGADSRSLYPRQKLVIDQNQRGFFGEDQEDSPWKAPRQSPIKGGFAKRLVARLLGLTEVRREYYRFDLGGSLFYKDEYENGTWDVLIAHSTPADEAHTWFFGVSIRTRANHWIGNYVQQWFGRTLCDEDESQVTAMFSNDPSLLPSPTSVVGDEPLLAFRRIYHFHLNRQKKLTVTPHT